jgi:hypothetical protein
MDPMNDLLYDTDIRGPLFEFLEMNYGEVRILEEIAMGRSRADAMMISVTENMLYGIEIKSDADTYARLERQVRDYDRYFDYNFIVAGTKHAYHIEEHVPEYWGIITVERVEKEPDFYLLRRPRPNPNVTWERKIEFMWRPELVQIQERNNMPRYKEKSKKFVADKIVERIGDSILENDIREQMCRLLYERDYDTIADTINEYRLSQNKHKRRKRRKKRW